MSNIGLQLYSIKELTSADFLGTLKKVKEIGYEGVEFAGYFNTPATELKKALDDLNLKAAGSHLGYGELCRNLDSLIEYNKEIGSPYIICPYIKFETADEYKKAAEEFNRIGEKCKAAGIQFGYHNHAHEFEKIGDKYIMDILAENTDPDFVHVELDTYWVAYAGLDTVEFLKKYGKRCSLIHFKDMNDPESKKDTEIGKGIVNFDEIARVCKELGTSWYIVEQEYFEIPLLQSIEESCRFMKNLLK